MSKRVDIKFKLETPEEMEKRAYRRRKYRLLIAIFILNLLILIFLLFQHYNLLPTFDAVEKKSELAKKTTEKPKKLGEILTDQAPIFHSGQSIPKDEISPYQHPIDTLKASFLSLDPTLSLGMFGIDISHWQGVIDWEKPVVGANDSPIDFVIVKATQGANFVDSQFESNWNGAQKAGKKVGAYHFYIYDDDPQEQAENFARTVDWKTGMIRPIVDLELDCASCTKPGISDDALVEKVRAFLMAVEKATGQKPIIYSYTSFYDTYLLSKLSEYDVWIAQYSTIKPQQIPVFPEEIGTESPAYVMWQFTNRQGITGWNEKVDASLIPTKFLDRVFIH